MYNSKLEIRMKAAELAATMCVNAPKKLLESAKEIEEYIIGGAELPEVPFDYNMAMYDKLMEAVQKMPPPFGGGEVMGVIGKKPVTEDGEIPLNRSDN